MPTTLARRMERLQGSASGAVMNKVAQLQREGKDIISLNVGEPDFPTPDNIKAAGIEAIEKNFTKYTPGAGIIELREAIADKLRTENHIDCDVDNIAVSVGAKQAIASGIMAIAGPGDEVIIPCPCYVSYAEIVRLAGAVPVFADLNPETFRIDLDSIEAVITPRTKAIIICTPNNPTGIVYLEENLRALAQMALRYDFFILSDEIYEKLVFDGARHFSIASISPQVRDHVITVNGFSKTYAMTGWRIGYVCARPDVTEAILKIQSQNTTSVCSISQKAALEALRGSQDEIKYMVHEFERRRNYLVQRLRSLPGIICPDVQGAFYLFFDATAYLGCTFLGKKLRTDYDLCDYLLEEGGVAMMPGSDYRAPGKIRISYATSMQNLRSAMDRIEAALDALDLR